MLFYLSLLVHIFIQVILIEEYTETVIRHNRQDPFLFYTSSTKYNENQTLFKTLEVTKLRPLVNLNVAMIWTV